MLARYYAGRRPATDSVQRYRGSPRKARLDHVAASLVAHRYGEAVVAQHLREWVRFTSYVDAQGGALPSSVHAPEAQAYLAPRLTHGSVSRRRFLRTSVRILLETDERGHVRRRVGTALAPTLGVGFEPAVRAYRLFLHEHRGLGERTIGKRAVPTGLQRPRMGGCVTLTGAQGWGGRRRRGLMLPYALRASGVDHRAPK